jgi:hypothetical protein
MVDPQQVITFVPAPMPEPIENIREDRGPNDGINVSFDYSVNEPLIQDEEEIGSDVPRNKGEFVEIDNNRNYNLLE